MTIIARTGSWTDTQTDRQTHAMKILVVQNCVRNGDTNTQNTNTQTDAGDENTRSPKLCPEWSNLILRKVSAVHVFCRLRKVAQGGCLVYQKLALKKKKKKLQSKQGVPWWRHQTETFSVLLGLCVRNSPVNGEFPSQRPVTRSFDIPLTCALNKRLSKQSGDWWVETQSRPLWRHWIGMIWKRNSIFNGFIWQHGTLLLPWFNFNTSSNYIHHKVFSEITYPSPNPVMKCPHWTRNWYHQPRSNRFCPRYLNREATQLWCHVKKTLVAICSLEFGWHHNEISIGFELSLKIVSGTRPSRPSCPAIIKYHMRYHHTPMDPCHVTGILCIS